MTPADLTALRESAVAMQAAQQADTCRLFIGGVETPTKAQHDLYVFSRNTDLPARVLVLLDELASTGGRPFVPALQRRGSGTV